MYLIYMITISNNINTNKNNNMSEIHHVLMHTQQKQHP